MKRKVVKHGPVTLIVSLPNSWVKRKGIESGDEVDVEELADGLLIKSDERSEELTAEFDTKGLDRTTLLLAIRGYYRLGYDTVNVTFSSSNVHYGKKGIDVPTIDVLRQGISYLMGYEIVHEEEGGCVIKDLQSPSLKEFDIVLRRVLLLIVDTAKEFADGVGNKSRLATIEHRHDTITKFISYCLRMLNKKSSPDRTSKYLFFIIAGLDRLTDLFKYAARDLSDHAKVSSPLKKILAITAQSLSDYASVHYKYDGERIRKIDENRYVVRKHVDELTSGVEIMVGTRMLVLSEMLLDFIEALSIMRE